MAGPTLKKPASSSRASAAPPPSSSRATPSLSPFLLVPVRCASCGANICGTKYSYQRCHKVVDEACMTMVGSTVHSFSCTSRAYGQEVSTPDVECHTCHFRVCPGCTTDGICTSCVERCRPSDPPSPKKPQFRREWLLTRSWLRYEATTDKMWCIACEQYPQLGHSVPFVQGTSNFMLCTLKHHQRSGSHAVSLALWQSGGRVTSVIKTLPPHVLQGILALFRTVYRIVRRAGHFSVDLNPCGSRQ